MVDVVSVVFDEPLDVLTRRAGLRTGVRYRTAESHVVANEVCSGWIFERVFHIRLLHLEVAVDVAAVVSFSAFRHLLMLLLRWSASLRRLFWRPTH